MTLKDVALLSNCSVATVSKAFKNSPEVSAETKKRIIAAAQQCGYIKKATSKTAVLGGIRTVVFADPKSEYINVFTQVKRLGEKHDFLLIYVAEEKSKAYNLMEQIGALAVIVADGSDYEEDKVFGFDGDVSLLKDVFEKIDAIVPKRKSRSKSGVEYKKAEKPQKKEQESTESEIWLL